MVPPIASLIMLTFGSFLHRNGGLLPHSRKDGANRKTVRKGFAGLTWGFLTDIFLRAFS
jgi:hypothetical protein